MKENLVYKFNDIECRDKLIQKISKFINSENFHKIDDLIDDPRSRCYHFVSDKNEKLLTLNIIDLKLLPEIAKYFKIPCPDMKDRLNKVLSILGTL